MELDPISHFERLGALLAATEITDREGKTISLAEGVSKALEMILAGQRKVMVIGNGGSAAIASHLHNDLCHGAGIQAMVFNDPSQLTALSNDYGYPAVFERPVRLWSHAGDLLLAISSSGKSENILRGVRTAQECSCAVITFSGFEPANLLRQMGDVNFYVKARSYGDVEVAHFALTHYLSDCAMEMAGRARSVKTEPASR